MPATRSQIEAAAKWGKCKNEKLAKRVGETGTQLMLYELAALAVLECKEAKAVGVKKSEPDALSGGIAYINGA
jgi:hypothetical protein